MSVSENKIQLMRPTRLVVHVNILVGCEADKLDMFAKSCEVLERALNLLELQTHTVGLIFDLEDRVASGRLIEKVVNAGHRGGTACAN